VLQRRGRQAEVLRGVVQAGRRGQAVLVHGAQAARPLDVRAAVLVFVRDRARGERSAPPRRRPVQQQRWQTNVPVAVPERQQRLEIGLHKGAQRMRVHGAVAQEKATKAEAEERRRRIGGKQRRRRRRKVEQVATVSDDRDDADDNDDDHYYSGTGNPEERLRGGRKTLPEVQGRGRDAGRVHRGRIRSGQPPRRHHQGRPIHGRQ